MSEINAALNKLIDETFIVYAGVLIERAGNKFITLKKKFDTLDKAKIFIDQSFFLIQKSIK